MSETDLIYKVGELSGQVAAIHTAMAGQNKILDSIQSLMIAKDKKDDEKSEGNALYRETVIEKTTFIESKVNIIENKMITFEKYTASCDSDRAKIAKDVLEKEEKNNNRFISLELSRSRMRGATGMLATLILGAVAFSAWVIEKWDTLKYLFHDYSK